ncbi:helix-turn-helix domain-containing protein [Streptomyces litchfieldiae]|uniref:Helix-turn-helix transcriptional regulator n=1 Tax=Streptomyces litchfieldiae TaxID=3075543 RepID=A0ABU2MPS8_9ACTN|nr:helix-turn-helix transcriptional regulator [Streptomyces sp. DSM 44938]MDT0342908.1 helix-turn-helix transcriptional regulator [Streptomyces sp. DSM 44938]
MNERQEFGLYLARLRRAAGMSQRDLAERLCQLSHTDSVTRNEISRWETGKRFPEVWLPVIAVALDVPLPDLKRAAAAARWPAPCPSSVPGSLGAQPDGSHAGRPSTARVFDDVSGYRGSTPQQVTGSLTPGTDPDPQRLWETPPGPTEHDNGDDPMKRRSLLHGALAAGMTGPAIAALTAARNDLDLALCDKASAGLAFWESTAERHGHGYNGNPPAHVLSDLVADLTELRPLLATSQTIAARTQLCRIISRMAGMAAIVLHDLGEHRESTRWFHSAERAAEESADDDVRSWVLAREAMVPLNFGAPAFAAALAERSRALSHGRPSAAGALACAVAARAYAASGNRDQALTAVGEAEQIVMRLSPDQRAHTWFGYPEQKHHVHLSQALTLLGETRRAYEQQERALALSKSPSVMTRALVAIDRASCLATDGEWDEAARVAAEAFGQLPPSYRKGLTHARAQTVYQSVRMVPAGEQLREVLQTAV